MKVSTRPSIMKYDRVIQCVLLSGRVLYCIVYENSKNLTDIAELLLPLFEKFRLTGTDKVHVYTQVILKLG